MKKKLLGPKGIIGLILFLFVLFFIFKDSFWPAESEPEIPKDSSAQANNFVGAIKCQSCHTQEYNEWLKSDHYMAMQPATDSTVEGDFNNVTYTADGVTSRFFKKGDKYFINTQGEDGKNHDYEIKYTFGYEPLQQYLIEFPGGRMQVTRASWDTRKKKWFHQYKGQKIPPGDWMHWTGNAQTWNSTCASCHSTNLKKNYDLETDTYHTTFSAVNVSCESCHGPGEAHLAYIEGAYKDGDKIAGSKILLPKNSGQNALITTCAPCHSRRSSLSDNNILASTEFLDNYVPAIPTTENFYADGQIREEDFVYTSFAQSKLFQAGGKCSDCHNMHTGKPLFSGNQLCISCHSSNYDSPKHTNHAINTDASKCVSCHMPGEYYMGNDFRRDHSFRVPRPDLSAEFGTPNACNSCHTDQSAAWAAEAVDKWYGPKRKYHFSEDLIPGSKADPDALPYLVNLLNRNEVPQIVKATADFYLKDIGTPQSLDALKTSLSSKDPQVRYETLRSLAHFDPQGWIREAAPLLNDKVRAVRVAAADLFLTIPPDQIPGGFAGFLPHAKDELKDFLFSQADFASGNVSLGDYFMRLGDFQNAIKFYNRGLKKDSLLNLARLNLSIAYSSGGQNEKALKVLDIARKIDPRNDAVYYNLGLLYNEMNNRKGALDAFEKAVQLKSSNPRVYYNYGLLLMQAGNQEKAEKVFLSGWKVAPDDESLNYVLAYFYVQQGQLQKAEPYARFLMRVNPNNPDYQGIFSTLKR